MKSKKFNRCLDLIRNGNEKGMNEIYNRYYAAVNQIVINKGNDAATAECITSAVFQGIKLMVKEIPTVGDPDKWIFDLAAETAANRDTKAFDKTF